MVIDFNKIFLLLSLVPACGDICEGSDFTTYQGTCVFTNDFLVFKDKIEVALDIIQEGVTNRYPKKYTKENIHGVYKSTSISFVNEDEIVTPGQCEYYIMGPNIFEIKLIYNDWCYLNNAFVHEIFHTLLIDIEDDDSHNKKWFMNGRSNEDFRLIYEKLEDICDQGI